MKLTVLPTELALCRLDHAEVLPAPSLQVDFWSLTVAGGEVSLVCDATHAPEHGTVVPGWRALRVAGPLDLALTGIMASLAGPLADAGVPILPIATHDTDYVLVPTDRLADAVAALRGAGHDVDGDRAG